MILRRISSLPHRVCIRGMHTGAGAVNILEQVQMQAAFFGVDPSSAYEPAIPVELFQVTASCIRDTFSVSWPVALLAMGASFRALTFPLYVGSILKGKSRSEAARELTDLRDMAKEAVLLRDQALVQNIDREYQHRMKAYGLTRNPFQGFGYALAAQLPWITTMMFALRGMSTQTVLFKDFILDSEFLWCPSLALADPFGVLPLLSTAAIVFSPTQTRPAASSADLTPRSLSTRDQLYVKYAIRGACFTFLPFTMQLPAGILLFFIFNTVVNRVSMPFILRHIWKPKQVSFRRVTR